MSPDDFATLSVEQQGQVATVTLLRTPRRPGGSGHAEVALAFESLRQDHGVRVVVLTGSGEHFVVPAGSEYYSNVSSPSLTDPAGAYRTFGGIIRAHQAMTEIEKPIVARVNGNAIGFGQSLVFACDLIVAREDAIFMDHHMGGTLTITEGGVQKEVGHDFASVPGDGGAALLPLYMSPAKAKEALMLAQPYTARELARLGIINYAVPAGELDAKVDDLVQRLLKRGAYALAWTKRVVNRRTAQQLNLALDAGIGYEMASFLQREKLKGEEPASL